MTGTIRVLKPKGFGFIQPRDDSRREGSHFFHARSLDGLTFESLKVGDVVEFDSTHSAKGLEAIGVRPAN